MALILFCPLVSHEGGRKILMMMAQVVSWLFSQKNKGQGTGAPKGCEAKRREGTKAVGLSPKDA